MKRLPEGPPYFPVDQITDQPERFLAAEMIREKILHVTEQEVPHSVAVLIEDWKREETDPYQRHNFCGAERPESDRYRIEGPALKRSVRWRVRISSHARPADISGVVR